jgi:cytochrome c oxidase subunit 3
MFSFQNKTFKSKFHYNFQKTPFHLLEPSPWPFFISLSLLCVTIGSVGFFHSIIFYKPLLFTGFIGLFMILFFWFRDIIREASFKKFHTKQVQLGLRMGMALFIVSEIMFFFGFFWAFFHASLSPAIEIGAIWPPKYITPIQPWGIPFLNTIILLSSGIAVTWAHHGIIEEKKTETLNALYITYFLAIFFTLLQVYEYIESDFSISDSVYGSTFYMATGFHGFHVLIGTLFLYVGTIRLAFNQFTSKSHFGFEAAAWYWHFVDVVWLFLFITIYWWGGN